MTDGYYEPGKELEVETKIKKSIFIAQVRVCKTENEAKDKLKEIAANHKQATHNCYAYRVGIEKVDAYYSDDGEPAGTAGKPILGAILRHDITNCLIVVTRYYGGTKLGVRGLIEAYGNSADAGLVASGIVHKRARIPYKIIMPDDMTGHAERLLLTSDTGPHFYNFTYEADVTLVCEVPVANAPFFESTLAEWQNTDRIISWKNKKKE